MNKLIGKSYSVLVRLSISERSFPETSSWKLPDTKHSTIRLDFDPVYSALPDKSDAIRDFCRRSACLKILSKGYYVPALNFKFTLDKEPDSFGIDNMLLLENPVSKSLFGIFREHRYTLLDDNRT